MSLLPFYESFWEKLSSDKKLSEFLPQLQALTKAKVEKPVQGDYPRWKKCLDSLPILKELEVNSTVNAVTCKKEIGNEVKKSITEAYKSLIPWRKGPFEMFDCFIDSEWQSWMKWSRIESEIPGLKRKNVLDVGSGNGYYMFRMFDQKPRLLMGIDPGLLQIIQFWSIEKYIESGSAILPLGIQDMPKKMQAFDVVFSMGVFYHRKNPIEHLLQLNDLIVKNGQLVLETLVVDGDERTCLLPHGRYAQMRNVWFLPSTKMLEIMLNRNGFKNVKLVDEAYTTLDEQRATEWMKFHSLCNFLNKDQTLTIEGYPLPKRATLIATKV